MINLMPDYMREEIGYARHNRVMLRWLVATIVLIAGVALMTLFGQFYINRNTKNLAAVAAVTQDRIGVQNLEATQQEIQTLSNNFTTITKLLQQQLLFSKMFIKIGSIIPDGAILRGITLTTTGSSAIDINIVSTTREAATQAFVNVSDSTNGLFEKADLLSVTCNAVTSTSSDVNAKYPCTMMVKVIIKTDSSFYFLNSLTSTGANQ